MSEPWIEALREPLRTMATRHETTRIELGKDGAWYVQEEVGETPTWHRHDGDGNSRVFSLFDDPIGPVLESVTGWLHEGWSVGLLAHKVGRRIVLSLERGNERAIAKLYRKDRQVLARWQSVEADPGMDLRTPRILDWNPDARALVMERVPGESLNQLWKRGDVRAEHADRILDVLRWLAAQAPPAEAEARHEGKDEMHLLVKRNQEIPAVLETPLPTKEILGSVLEALAEDPVEEMIRCHRDLHDKQVFLSQRSCFLIDLDLTVAGPRYLDAGNILAHLRLRGLQFPEIPWQEMAARIVEGLRADDPRAEASLHRWVAATLMRLTLIYPRRRHREGLLEALIESTGQALARAGEWEVLR